MAGIARRYPYTAGMNSVSSGRTRARPRRHQRATAAEGATALNGPAAAADGTREADGFARALLAWFEHHGRHDLPWQVAPTAYRIWVSEIMLQQTQVATVIPFYERFMARFPTVGALATAPLDAVLHEWSGLGYYARARNLHRAAKQIRDDHAGQFPRDFDAALALPGIGRSTAGAILALALDERHAILDGNVKRVLARWFAVEGFPGSALVAKQLWQLSERVTPPRDAGAFTQAIMDLGATLCTRAKPACERCPINTGCRARREGRVSQFPGKRPARTRPLRRVWWLIVRQGTYVLLERRPDTGVWGGLWGFPEFANRELAERALEKLSGQPIASARLERAPIVEHSFSHFDLEAAPLLVDVVSLSGAIMEGPQQTWYNSTAPARIGLSAPVAAILARLGIAAATATLELS